MKNERVKPDMVFNGMINVPKIEIKHRGYTIQPKLDMGSTPWLSNGNTFRKGYIVVKNGCLIMPGGVWHSSVSEAKTAINILIKAGGKADIFWKLMRDYQGLGEYTEV